MNPIDSAYAVPFPEARSADPLDTPDTLEWRLLAMIGTPRGQAPGSDEGGPDAAAARDDFVRRWFADDFLQAMLLGDEEKLGVKAEEWT